VMADVMSHGEKADQVKVLEFRESRNGPQLLILGTIENTGSDTLNSVSLQAELLDDQGKMVYECDEYVSQSIKAGAKENFQIKCGCHDKPVPAYKSVTVRVVKASVY